MAVLSRSMILYSGDDELPVVDYTDDTDWPQTELASMANLGEAATGEWVLRDALGAIPDALAERVLNGHNVLVCTVGTDTLWRGRIAGADHFRGRAKAGRASEWSITVEDANSHLRGIILHADTKPAQTDIDRAASLANVLSGFPRVTTNLDTSTYIINANPVLLPAKTFNGVTPFEFMEELASNSDKETWVSIDNELMYFDHDYAGYDCPLRISDDLADADADTYAPWDPHGSEFSRNILSGLRVYYGTDLVQKSVEVTNANAADYDYWEEVFWDSESTTDAQAIARAQKMLDYRSLSDLSFSCSIGPMDGNQAIRIKAGQRIAFKARAARGGRTGGGAFIGDDFLTIRIRELRWTFPGEDLYIAHLELDRPKRTRPFSQGSPALTQIKPTPVGQGDCFSVGGWASSVIISFPDCQETINNLTDPPEFVSVSCVSGASLGYVDFDYGGTLPIYGGVATWSGTITLPTISSGNRHAVRFFFATGGPAVPGGPDLVGGFGLSREPGSYTGVLLNEGTDDFPLTAILGGTIHYKLQISGTDLNTKVWASSDPEPSSYQVTSTITDSPTEVGIGDEWQNTGSAIPAGKVTIHSSIVWCSGQPLAYFGRIYGPVLVAIADGVASSWTLPYPTVYTAGTLDVRVEGIAKQAIEDDPTTGAFSLSFVPTAGDEVTAVWWVPAS